MYIDPNKINNILYTYTYTGIYGGLQCRLYKYVLSPILVAYIY